MLRRTGRDEAGQAQHALIHRGEADPGAGGRADGDGDAATRSGTVRGGDGDGEGARRRVDADPGEPDGARRAVPGTGTEHVHRHVRARSPGRIDRHVHIRAARRDLDGVQAVHAVAGRQHGRVPGERRHDADPRRAAWRVLALSGGHVHLVGRVRAVGRDPPGAEADGGGGEAVALHHLEPVAAEIEPLGKAERPPGGDGDVGGFQRLIAEHGLIPGQLPAHHQPPVRPLPHQAEPGGHRRAHAIRVHRRDLEHRLAARIDGVREPRADADLVAGRAHRDARMGVAGAARWVIHRNVQLGAHGVGGVWGGLDEQRQGGPALRIGGRQLDLQAVRRELLALQPDPVSGKSGRRGGVPHQLHRGFAAEVGRRGAIQETRGDRHRIGPARLDRAGRGQLHGHSVRHEGVHAELGPADGRLLRVRQHLHRPGPGRRRSGQHHRHMNGRIRPTGGHLVQEGLPVRPLDEHMRRQVHRLPGVVAQQRHDLHRFAGPVDAAVRPGEGVQRPGMRRALHAAVRQVERGGGEVQRDQVGALRAVDGLRRLWPGAAQQWGGKAGHAVRVRGGLGEDVVAAGQQAQLHAGPGQGVGEAADLYGKPIRAAPDRGRQVGPDHHLGGGRAVLRGAVAWRGKQEIGARFGEGVWQRQRGADYLVRLVADVGPPFPDHLAVAFLAVERIQLQRLPGPVVAGPRHQVTLRQPQQLQLHAGQVDAGEGDARGLATWQQEHAAVEDQARGAVAHRHRQHGILVERQTVLARHPGPQRDLRRGAQAQAGDADLVAFACHGDAGLRRLDAHPITGHEVRPAHRGRGELDAGLRWIALRFRADAAYLDAGGTAGIGEHPAVSGVIRCPFLHRFQCADGRFGPVHDAERLRHRQQGRYLVCTRFRHAEGLPGRLRRPGRIGRSPALLRAGQGEPEVLGGAPRSDTGLE